MNYMIHNGILYHSDDELRHYGVLGMKWGVRRARKKLAKQNYKAAEDKAFKRYERDINKLESGYKRGQKLSKADQKRERDIENRYKDSVNAAKEKYNKAKKSKARDAEIADRLYSKQSSDANKLVTSMSMGKTLAQTMIFGSYGALKYNEAKARGASRGRAAVEGVLYYNADLYLGGLMSTGKYLDNRLARKKK